MIVELCRELVRQGFVVVDVSEFAIDIKPMNSTQIAQINLSNLRRLLLSSETEAHPDLIRDFCTQITFGFGGADSLIEPKLFPKIVMYLENKSLSAPWSKSLVSGQIDLVLAADYGPIMKQLNPLQLVAMGKSIRDLIAEAVGNLAAIEIVVESGFEHGLRVSHGDGHDAARLLLAPLKWPNMRYAAIPSRDVLWLLPHSPSKQAVLFVQSEFKRSAYPISDLWFDLSRIDHLS